MRKRKISDAGLWQKPIHQCYVLIWGQDDFPVSYSNRDTYWRACNRHSGRFMVDTGVLFSNIKSPSHECSMISWSLTSNNDFPTYQIFDQFRDLDNELVPNQITSGFYGTFATGVACQQGTLILPDTCFLTTFGTCLCSYYSDQFSRTCHVFSRLFVLNIPRYFLDFACSRLSNFPHDIVWYFCKSNQ